MVLVGPAYPFRGGIAHFSNRLAQALGDRYEVLLLTFSRQYPKLLFPGKTQMETSKWDLPNDPVRLVDSINPLSWKKAGHWLARQRPDMVMFVHWLPFFVPAYLGILRAMKKRMKATGAQKGLPPTLPEISLFLHNVKPHKSFPLTLPLMRRLIGASDSYFTMSDHVTKDLKSIKPEARVLEGFHPMYDHYHPAIPIEEARQALTLPERPTMLFFGYIRPYKGLDILIEAMPAVRKHIDAQLIVAGEFYENEAEFREQVQRLGLESADGEAPVVRFYPEYIPNEEVHLYFSAAEVVVQPYRSATPSGVAQTAFFFDKPMIVTDLGVLAEVVPDGVAGYVVPPEDPPALADAIVRFFKGDPQKMAGGAHEQGKKYSWEALAKQFEAFYS